LYFSLQGLCATELIVFLDAWYTDSISLACSLPQQELPTTAKAAILASRPADAQ
jgi:hypothetical protein